MQSFISSQSIIFDTDHGTDVASAQEHQEEAVHRTGKSSRFNTNLGYAHTDSVLLSHRANLLTPTHPNSHLQLPATMGQNYNGAGIRMFIGILGVSSKAS